MIKFNAATCLLGLSFFFLDMAVANSDPPGLDATDHPPPRKRVLVFTDPSGGGHIAASRAVEDILGDDYEIRTITPIKDIPFINSYNKIQKKGNIRRLRFLTSMQPLAEFFANRFSARKVIKTAVLDFNPDLIISVIPLVNRLTHEILKQMNRPIPLIILTTDLYASHFFPGMNRPGPLVRVSLAFDDDALKAPLLDDLAEENFIVLGFPLRAEFGQTLEEQREIIHEVRQELGIRESDKTVLIMMGAQGTGNAITRYAKLLAKSNLGRLGKEDEKLHVVALCGNNDHLRKRTEAVAQSAHPHVVVHALGMKPGRYVAALMQVANLLITKPGGASTNEAFAAELYTLYHTDKSFWPSKEDLLLPWEEGNMRYSIERQWGERINSKDTFLQQVENALPLPRLKIPNCAGRNFKNNLKNYVDQLLKVETRTEEKSTIQVN